MPCFPMSVFLSVEDFFVINLREYAHFFICQTQLSVILQNQIQRIFIFNFSKLSKLRLRCMKDLKASRSPYLSMIL